MDLPSVSTESPGSRSNEDYFENDKNIRILSRRNETTGEDDPDFDFAFQNMDRYMKLAFECSYEALQQQEVPVGCVFVYKGEVIASGRNKVNLHTNSILHAEIVALRNAELWCDERKQNIHEIMKNVTLYVNLEPCQMCASAMQLLNVPRIFFGACNDRFGGVVSVSNIYDYMDSPPIMDLVSGLGWNRTVSLLQDFYCNTNTRAPEHKRLSKSNRKGSKTASQLDEDDK